MTHNHDQSHSCCHHGPHTHSAAGLSSRRLAVSALLTILFVALEFTAGLRSNSLALISDAWHNFSDVLALMLSWYAIRVSLKPATALYTYGFHRVSILTALANALTILVIGVLMAQAAIVRLMHPLQVQSSLMMGVAALALVLNLGIALVLRGEAKHSINVRSAFLHMAGDALASLGVVMAGAVIHFTGWEAADPLTSLLLALLILWSSWSIIRDTLNVLLESTPRGMDTNRMASDMLTIAGVQDVHDLHVWTIADEMYALSCHIQVSLPQPSDSALVVRAVKSLLAEKYAIDHVTIETECGGCGDGGLYCELASASADAPSAENSR